MGIHLTVISYPRTIHPMFEAVARAANYRLDEHKFVRCQEADGLRMAIKDNALIQDGRPDVSILDLVGHGRAGYFQLGDEPLVDGSTVHPALVEISRYVLPQHTTIRLLGCYTGVDSRGLEMLASTKQLLGREIVAASDILQPWHFGEKGLKEGVRLMSSIPRGYKSLTDEPLRPSDPQSQEDAWPWIGYLPKGYEVIGRAHAAPKIDFSIHHGGAKFVFGAERRLVLLEDKPGQPPLLLQWNEPGPVPQPTGLLTLKG
jgi:hypothetical protein